MLSVLTLREMPRGQARCRGDGDEPVKTGRPKCRHECRLRIVAGSNETDAQPRRRSLRSELDNLVLRRSGRVGQLDAKEALAALDQGIRFMPVSYTHLRAH